MKSHKMYFSTGLSNQLAKVKVDYPPTAGEVADRIARFKERKRAVTKSNAEQVWSLAADMTVEAGGVPMYAEHVELGGSKPKI